MDLEAGGVDHEGEDDQSGDAGDPVFDVRALGLAMQDGRLHSRPCKWETWVADTHHRHRQVSELVPQVLDGVQPDQRGDELPNPLDTADAANRPARKYQPDPPVVAERAMVSEYPSRGECAPTRVAGCGT